MIKLIRRIGEKRPWAIGIVFAALAVLFIFGMGWWGFDQASQDVVAQVGKKKLSLRQYQQAYQSTLNRYRSALGDQFNTEMETQLNIRKIALDQSIERLLWVQYAEKMGLSVSDVEVQNAILSIPAFLPGGHFDQEYYKRLLASNQMSPQQFESSMREDLLIQKAQELVRDSVALTPDEVTQTRRIAVEQARTMKSPPPDMENQVQTRMLIEKQGMAIDSFTSHLRRQTKVTIKPEYLS